MSRWNWIGNLGNIDSRWWSLSRFARSSHSRASRLLCSLFCAWSSLSKRLLYCITVLSPRIFISSSRKRLLLPLDTLSCLSKLNIDLSYVDRKIVILVIQLSEHVAHPGIHFCGYLIQRLGLNLLTLQQLLHHHTQTLQLIWLTVPVSWNSLLIALRLSLVLVLNMPSRSLLHAEDVPLVVFQ
ncbi:hypothetical protein YC2023_073591 [Brassica napus]